MKKLTVLLFFTLSLNSYADQCQYITKDSAATAVKLISASKKKTGGILELCQNCGEKSPQQTRVNQIDVISAGTTDLLSMISINGRLIDLAYTYVSVNAEAWVNLGKLTSCEVIGESAYITEKVSADGQVKFLPSSKY